MNRAFAALLTAVCITGLSNLPSLADETSADSSGLAADKTVVAENSASCDDGTKLAENKDSKDTKGDAKDGKKDAPKAAKTGGGSTDLATRLASFAVGTVIGTPIAIVRRTGIEIAQGEHDMIGDADRWYKKAAMVLPGGLAVPYGMVSGGIGGCMYAVKNAWVGSGDEPFGKEAFSLGDIGN